MEIPISRIKHILHLFGVGEFVQVSGWPLAVLFASHQIEIHAHRSHEVPFRHLKAGLIYTIQAPVFPHTVAEFEHRLFLVAMIVRLHTMTRSTAGVEVHREAREWENAWMAWSACIAPSRIRRVLGRVKTKLLNRALAPPRIRLLTHVNGIYMFARNPQVMLSIKKGASWLVRGGFRAGEPLVEAISALSCASKRFLTSEVLKGHAYVDESVIFNREEFRGTRGERLWSLFVHCMPALPNAIMEILRLYVGHPSAHPSKIPCESILCTSWTITIRSPPL